MPGPWEKYANAQKPKADSGDESSPGPWAKYQSGAKASPSANIEDMPAHEAAGFLLRSIAEGHTAGLSEPLISRVKAAIKVGILNPLQSEAGAEGAQPETFSDAVNADIEQRKAEKAANTKSDIAMQLAGAVLPTPVNVGTKAAALGGAIAKAGISKTGRTAVTAAEKLAQRAAVGGAAGLAGGLGFEGVRQLAERPDGFIEGGSPGSEVSTAGLASMGIGALVPYAGHAIQSAARGAGMASSVAGKKLLSSGLGVPEKVTEKYLKDSKRINQAPAGEQIRGRIDEEVTKIRDAFESAKISKAEAQSAVKELKQSIVHELGDQKGDLREKARAADALLTESFARAKRPLEQVKAPTDQAGRASQMVGELKAKVRAKSGQALETLKTSGSEIDLQPVYASIDDSISRLKDAGTDEALATAGKLQEYKARLMKQHWAKIKAPEAKKLIQGLDEITEYSPMAGSFDQAKNRAFKGVRGEMDKALKEATPEYRAQMSELAPEVQLLDEANAAFGSPEIAVSKLSRMTTPRGEFDRTILGKLEAATGHAGEISSQADEFAKVQKLLRDPQAMEKLKRSLPEYGAYEAKVRELARRNPKWTRAEIEQRLSKSEEARALSKATSELSRAESAAAPYKGLTSATVQSKIAQAARGDEKAHFTREQLRKLGESTGENFLQQIDDRQVLDAFEKPYANGARNTLLWTTMGLVGGGLPGAGGGAAIGQFIDRYGPKMGKKVLDAVIAARGRGGDFAKAIELAKLPRVIEEDLIRNFRTHVMLQNPAAQEEPKGFDRFAQSGANKLGLSSEETEMLLKSPKGKKLLIEASDLSPGSKAMQRIKDQIEKDWSKR